MMRRNQINTDEEFFNQFKNSSQNAINPTPITGRPLNTAQFQMMNYTDKKKKNRKSKQKKKNRQKKNQKNSRSEEFKLFNTGNVSTTLLDAILGAILLFILTSSSVKNMISTFIGGFYYISESKYMMNNGVYDAGTLPGTIIIKSDKSLSLKGKLILMGLYILLFIIIKTWFIVE